MLRSMDEICNPSVPAYPEIEKLITDFVQREHMGIWFKGHGSGLPAARTPKKPIQHWIYINSALASLCLYTFMNLVSIESISLYRTTGIKQPVQPFHY